MHCARKEVGSRFVFSFLPLHPPPHLTSLGTIIVAFPYEKERERSLAASPFPQIRMRMRMKGVQGEKRGAS